MFIVPKTRLPYPQEFRRDAVALVRAGRSIGDVAESLGVSQQSLRYWVKQEQLNRRERDDGLTDDEKAELRELRRLEQEKRSSTEPRPSSQWRPRPGEPISDHFGGEGPASRSP
jgi:transposase